MLGWLRTWLPPRHERRRQKRIHRFTALVGAAIAGLHDAPLWTLVRGALGLNDAGKADGVAGQHRLEPAQFSKAGRRPPDRNLLAARDRLARQALAVGDHDLHADRSDMPSGCRETAEQRVSSGYLIEVKGLRIELHGEFLDQFGGEGERPEFAPRTDFNVLEETHRTSYSAASARRRTMIGETISPSVTPAAFRTAPL